MSATLTDRLRAIRRLLADATGAACGDEPVPSGADGLDDIVVACGLSPFERDVLVLAAGCELDGRIAAMCAALAGDPAKSFATFGVALRMLPGAHWDAVEARGPLRALALVTLDRNASAWLTRSRLSVDERVLLALVGLDTVDELLADVATARPPGDDRLTDRHGRLVDEIAGRWHGGPLALRAPEGSERRELVRGLTARLGALRWWQFNAASIPADPAEQRELISRLDREVRLTGAPILLDLDDVGSPPPVGVCTFVERLVDATSRVVLAAAAPVVGLPVAELTVDVPERTLAENVGLWRTALGPAAVGLNGHVDRLAAQFRLPLDQLAAVAADVGTTAGSDVDAFAARLWGACRQRSRADLDGLAERVVPTATWDDLVLAPRELGQLADLLRHARHRAIVHERWGICGASRRATGVTALFCGPSGTGKSFAAEVIAAELDVDLYRVDLSRIVSKYIGETEKNLSRLFDAAEHSGAVLLIDEADALFGQRSEVKDSHDRYANIEVSYLLARMEHYRGLAILTTNLRANIDEAFVRRLAFIVTFPFPQVVERTMLWERTFGRDVPVDDLDHGRLAQLNLSGGSIRNVAVHAAFLAAERGTAVTMADLLRGAQSEYAKLDRPLTPTELAGWPG